MDQPVELAEGVEQLVGQVVVVLLYRSFQVQRADRWLRVAGGLDFIIDRFQFAQGPTQQDHGRAMGGAAQCAGAADAVAGAGNQDHAALQQVLGGLVVKHRKTPWSVAAPARGTEQRHSRY